MVCTYQNGVRGKMKGKLAYTWLLKFVYADVACEGFCCTQHGCGYIWASMVCAHA